MIEFNGLLGKGYMVFAATIGAWLAIDRKVGNSALGNSEAEVDSAVVAKE